MAFEKTVKGTLNGQIAALMMILVLLMGIGVYWYFCGEENQVAVEERQVELGEFNSDMGTWEGTYVDEWGDPEGVTIKAYPNKMSNMMYDPSKFKFTTGNTVPVCWSEKYGYTLYNPNNLKYSDKIYNNN